MRINFKWLYVILIFAIQQPAMALSQARKEYSKKIKFNPGGEISLKADDGNVEIIGWDNDEVLIEAELIAHAFSSRKAEAKVEQIRVRVHESTDFIRISAHGPSNTDVEYRIHVPMQTNISTRSDDGNIRIENVTGSIDLRSSDGDIRMRDIRGEIRVRTDDGKVYFAGAMENIDIQTEDGDVSGEAELSGKSYIRTDDGDVELELVLPDNVQPPVYIETDDGRVRSDFPVWSERVQLRNSGEKIQIEVRTNDGDIRLTRK